MGGFLRLSLSVFAERVGVHSVWYFGAAHKHYIGPQSNLGDHSVQAVVQDEPSVAETEKAAA